MKNTSLRLIALALVVTAWLGTIFITYNIKHDLFKFSSEGETLTIIVQNFNLTNLLLILLVTQGAAILAIVAEVMYGPNYSSYSNPDILDQ